MNKYLMANNSEPIAPDDFVLWLRYNNYIIESEQQKYYQIQNIYDLSNRNILKNYKFISIQNGVYNKRKINSLMVDRIMYLNGEK